MDLHSLPSTGGYELCCDCRSRSVPICEFAEVEAVTRQGEIFILNFSTDPGNPITIVSKTGAADPRESAYLAFYKEMNWPDPKKYDAIYVLNRLGRSGWEVIHVNKEKTEVFTSKDPATKTEYLLKRKIATP